MGRFNAHMEITVYLPFWLLSHEAEAKQLVPDTRVAYKEIGMLAFGIFSITFYHFQCF